MTPQTKYFNFGDTKILYEVQENPEAFRNMLLGNLDILALGNSEYVRKDARRKIEYQDPSNKSLKS